MVQQEISNLEEMYNSPGTDYSLDSFTNSVNNQEVSFTRRLDLGLLSKLDIAEVAQNVASTSYLKEVKHVSRCFVEKDLTSNQWQVIT